MAVQRTFSIIKPDAVAKNVIGEITTRFEKAGLKVVASKLKQLSKAEAEGFYAEHSERAFGISSQSSSSTPTDMLSKRPAALSRGPSAKDRKSVV